MGVWTDIHRQRSDIRNALPGNTASGLTVIQYRLRGKIINDVAGWWRGAVNQSQGEVLLASLLVNQKSDQGLQTLREMREINQERRLA